jgi:bifunctional DNase/RNase
LCNVLETFGRRVVAVTIDRLDSGVFYASLVFEDGTTISARPSDAIAIALRVGGPISVADEVFDEAGVETPEVEEDVEVEAFREFLDNVSPEDFGADDPSPQN